MGDGAGLLFPFLTAGLLMGLRHAFDPDHVVAVSALISSNARRKAMLRYAALWGLGHTSTLLVTGLIVLVLQQSMADHLASAFEGSVGFMLILLGTTSVIPQANRQPRFMDVRSYLVGTVHGLAGSAALMLLVLSTVQSTSMGILYILVFGVGSIVGMVVVSALLSVPLTLAMSRERLFGRIRTGVGLVSIAMGLVIVIRLI